MDIDSVSTKPKPYMLDAQTRAQGRKDFKALQNDLQSGDIGSAQKDFATLLQDVPQLQNQLKTNSTTSLTGQTSSPTDGLASLSAALNAGDLGGAQSAMSSLQHSSGWHHHHRHQSGESGPSPQTDPLQMASTAAASSTAPVAG
jgi:hypothetical protein